MSTSEIELLLPLRHHLNIIAHGTDKNPNEEEAGEEKAGESLTQRRRSLYIVFGRIYKLIHLALAHLLPYSAPKGARPQVPPQNLGSVYFSRAWILAAALMPAEKFVSHARRFMPSPVYKSFRELAHNLKSDFFPLTPSLKETLVNKFDNPLTLLAGNTPLRQTKVLDYIEEAFPALQFAADALTRTAATCLFPGKCPLPLPNKDLVSEKFSSFT